MNLSSIQQKLLLPTITILSICLTFIFTIILLNFFRFTLFINKINNTILDLFDSSYSNNPLTYLKFGILTFILIFMGNWLTQYLESSSKSQRIRTRYNHTTPIRSHIHIYQH